MMRTTGTGLPRDILIVRKARGGGECASALPDGRPTRELNGLLFDAMGSNKGPFPPFPVKFERINFRSTINEEPV